MGSGRGWPTTRSTRSIWCRGHPGRTCGSRANKPWTSRVGNVLPFARSSSVLTPTLLACYAMSGVIHLASISLNTLLPFHVVALGGSRTQVGLLFSATTVVSMALRPAVGGWVDRFGARWVILPGIAVLAVASLALHVPVTPEAVIAVMVGTGIGNGLVSMTASVLTVRATGVAHRGEALSLYYLASSLAIAVAPPMAFGLRGLGGMPLAFAAVTGLADDRRPAPGRRQRGALPHARRARRGPRPRGRARPRPGHALRGMGPRGRGGVGADRVRRRPCVLRQRVRDRRSHHDARSARVLRDRAAPDAPRLSSVGRARSWALSRRSTRRGGADGRGSRGGHRGA